jgi:hypothetical protein
VPQPSERGHMCPRCDSAVRLLLPSPTGEVGGRSRPGGGSAALVVDRKIPPPQPSPQGGGGESSHFNHLAPCRSGLPDLRPMMVNPDRPGLGGERERSAATPSVFCSLPP